MLSMSKEVAVWVLRVRQKRVKITPKAAKAPLVQKPRASKGVKNLVIVFFGIINGVCFSVGMG